MKTFAISLVSSLCVMAALAWLQTARAQAVFQTTFADAACPAWDQSMGLADANVCQAGDGISGNGAWTTSNGSRDQITAAANNPAGGGGKGFRHWAGNGVNNAGGGIVVQWSGVPEMWIRYYIRFQLGFSWTNGNTPSYIKTIYCNRGQGTFYFGMDQNRVGGYVESNGGRVSLSTVTWSQWQGGPTGDGNFHVFEVHAKMNTTGSSSDGIFEFWLDGSKIFSDTNVHFANTTGATFTNCAIGENHASPQNGADSYMDFDDIAVSTTGYIGPIGTLGLTTPKNLRVQ